jgi:bifunctional NMN adenylyltransferase/nudix hydrolase
MSKTYDYSVLIGRFNPCHAGHVKVIAKALEISDYIILVLGSQNIARNTRNPFTVAERKEMILASLPLELIPRVVLTSANDYMYNDTRWIAGIQSAVQEAIHIHKQTAIYTNNNFKDYNFRIALAGMHKDGTSYYLNNFPMWDNSIAVTPAEWDGEILSATAIRKRLFNHELEYCSEMAPEAKKLIYSYMENDKVGWDRLFADHKYENSYEAIYGKGPHVTVDGLVVQSGNILLVERGQEYGRGLLALPGGFLNPRERIIDACIREMREETRLKVPEKVLLGSLEKVEVFDNPYRSNRSHIITHVHHFNLNPSGELPKVQGADDAAKAHWYPISLIQNMAHMFFEDHYYIIAKMLGL